MEIIRNIIKSNVEPPFKEVAWLDTSTFPYKLKFYELGGWKVHQEIDGVNTKVIEDQSGITKVESSYGLDNKISFIFYNIKGDKGDKGDKGVDGTVAFDDLTPSQIEELQKPVLEALKLLPFTIEDIKDSNDININ